MSSLNLLKRFTLLSLIIIVLVVLPLITAFTAVMGTVLLLNGEVLAGIFNLALASVSAMAGIMMVDWISDGA